MTTPALPVRVVLLRALVARQGGEWAPARVARAYKDARVDAPKHTTHRADLKLLHRLGVLDRRDQPGRTHYVPSRQAKGDPRSMCPICKGPVHTGPCPTGGAR